MITPTSEQVPTCVPFRCVGVCGVCGDSKPGQITPVVITSFGGCHHHHNEDECQHSNYSRGVMSVCGNLFVCDCCCCCFQLVFTGLIWLMAALMAMQSAQRALIQHSIPHRSRVLSLTSLIVGAILQSECYTS